MLSRIYLETLAPFKIRESTYVILVDLSHLV
jgi:hypothetical protein